MRAWKFLATGRIAPFSGVRWPEPGGWMEANAAIGLGVHACAPEDLPYWFDEELWEVELAGPVTRGKRQLVASRGRLVAPVGAWSSSIADFTGSCIARTRHRVIDALIRLGNTAAADRLASEFDPERMKDTAADLAASGVDLAGYVFDVIRRRPYPGLCAYIAATAAAAADPVAGHDEERALQASWLRDRLDLRTS
jgi:hypothetical protein